MAGRGCGLLSEAQGHKTKPIFVGVPLIVGGGLCVVVGQLKISIIQSCDELRHVLNC